MPFYQIGSIGSLDCAITVVLKMPAFKYFFKSILFLGFHVCGGLLICQSFLILYVTVNIISPRWSLIVIAPLSSCKQKVSVIITSQLAFCQPFFFKSGYEIFKKPCQD